MRRPAMQKILDEESQKTDVGEAEIFNETISFNNQIA